MAKRKVRTTPTSVDKKIETPKKTETQKEEKMIKQIPMKTICAVQSRTVNLGDFESTRIEFSVTEQISADADVNAALDTIFETVEAKVDEKLKPYEDVVDGDAQEPEDTPDDESEPKESKSEDTSDDELEHKESEPEDTPDEKDEISEEKIMVMKRKELAELIETEGINDLDHKDHKKINDLRLAVIDALFEEDDSTDSSEDSSDGTDEWDDSEWEDD